MIDTGGKLNAAIETRMWHPLTLRDPTRCPEGMPGKSLNTGRQKLLPCVDAEQTIADWSSHWPRRGLRLLPDLLR